MPLHGKIVVIKRSGGDGTEFPLTATCLFGRNTECDIRIQLPQVSKEHCRIDLNENKEVVLTNLSSVNPTRVNGEAMQQSDRLKHGDVITIIDRSFRFESAPAPTPKKRLSKGGRTENIKVLKDKQVCTTADTGAKGISEATTDPHLKDGTNNDNIQRSLDKTMELESKEDVGLLQGKTDSPFSDLYQMIKKSLDVKTPRSSSVSLLQTPASRFCSPKFSSARKTDVKPIVFTTEDKSTPKKVEADVVPAAETETQAENTSQGTPKSAKKQRKSIQITPAKIAAPKVEETETVAQPELVSPGKRIRASPQRFTACEVAQQVSPKSPKSPSNRRKSKEVTSATPEEEQGQAITSPKAEEVRRASPRNSGKVDKEASKKRKSGEIGADVPEPCMKRKRVSFGGHLCPELFDKRLPPDSPLRKGADPRRSLGHHAKSKQSLLRRASAIGLLQEFDNELQSPAKARTPSPKKSPKSRSPSPKAATPAKNSPRAKTPSPKAATPAQTPVQTPGVRTPAVQGRFSVSRISTPSPVAEEAACDCAAMTPMLKRKSIRCVSHTPNKSAAKIMRRRSGISRASMKVTNTWAGIVRFGQTKAPVVAPAKQMVIRKTTKKAVPKPQTPARKLPGHVSTGHADSPVTIVVGRAHRQKVTLPTGAAPRLVTNTALLRKNMKMDEDLSGVCEMFKTPVTERKRKSVINDVSVMKTPVADLCASIVDPSVLNTPEEPGEMMVSPLTVSSTVKCGRYNNEAVQRFLDGEEDSSFVADAPATETPSEDSTDQQCADLKTADPVATPKQKPEAPECLTGVKRIMKTPRQKAEPIEDLRGKILKTPKQKMEQQECLTGVKSLMKTPQQEAEPTEDLSGTILQTPIQKPQQQECLSEVKSLKKTPRQKAEPIEDLSGEILETPIQKLQQQECLTGVKSLMKTPQQGAAPVEDLQEKLPETPKQKPQQQECLTGVKRIMKTPRQKSEPIEDLRGKILKTPKQKIEQQECLTGVKSLMKTPQQDAAPVEKLPESPSVLKADDGAMEVVETTENTQEPAEELCVATAASDHVKSVTPVEEVQLTEEPLADSAQTNEVEQTSLDCDVDVAKELDFALEEPQQDVPSDVIDNVEIEKATNAVVVEAHVEEEKVAAVKAEIVESSVAMETTSEVLVAENLAVEPPKVDTVVEHVSEEQQAEMEPATSTETPAPEPEKKPVRGGRRGKVVEPEAPEEKQEAAEQPEEPPASAPVRGGRRGKKAEAAAPPAAKKTTRGRVTKTTESSDVEPAQVAPKPKRGRGAKKASDEVEAVEEVATEAEVVPEAQSEQSLPVSVEQEPQEGGASLEKAVSKPKRGRKARQAEESVPEQQHEPQADLTKEAQSEVSSSVSDENESSDAMETVQPVSEAVAEVEAEMEVVTQKPVRGRRAKAVESRAAEDKKEVEEQAAEPVVSAPVRGGGRRGKKTEAAAPPPAARQTKRGRNAKVEESTTSDVQTEVVPEKAVEATEVIEDPAVEEAAVKPVKGRRTKRTPAPPQLEPENPEIVTEEPVVAEEQPQTSVPAVEKPKRGRKAKPDTVEEAVVAEDAVVAVETKQQSQPLVRARRGKNAKQEEEKQESDIEAIKSQEPVKKSRRTKKAEPEQEETVESVVPEEAEVPLVAEPAAVVEAVKTAAKPRRGGRKAKPDTESETPVETTEVPEVPAVAAAEKPKRGGRGKRVMEEVAVAVVAPEEEPAQEPEAQQEDNTEPEPPVVKNSRARGAKTAVKKEVSEAAVPAKRARRGAALPVEETESTVEASESASTLVEPVKKGKRAAAKPKKDDAPVPSEEAKPEAVVEDTQSSKRAVRWKAEPEVFEIPKATPKAKAVRGRKAKPADQADTESKDESMDAGKTGETQLSEKAEEVKPAKRARRGAKGAEVQAESTSVVESEEVEVEVKTKPRRGRLAKK